MVPYCVIFSTRRLVQVRGELIHRAAAIHPVHQDLRDHQAAHRLPDLYALVIKTHGTQQLLSKQIYYEKNYTFFAPIIMP